MHANRKTKNRLLATRFRGLLPVVVDIETSGLNPATDALLEIAAVTLQMDEHGYLFPDQTYTYHIEPFIGAHIDPESLAINHINPTDPLRYAIPEQHALHAISLKINKLLQATQCQRAVLVGHNAWFDLAFIQAALKRCQLNKGVFHSFTSFDTATLAAVTLGETVLARATRAAGIKFDINQAHSALYDAECTAQLFCYMVNLWNK